MIYRPDRGVPLVVQNRDALEYLARLSKATGSITFGANATNTKILTLYDQVFEFLTTVGDVGAGNIAVQIGGDAEATRDNLLAVLPDLTKVNSDIALVTATAVSTDGISVVYWTVGADGIITITTDDTNITVVGMSCGHTEFVMTPLGFVTIASSGTPVPFSAVSVLATRVMVVAKKVDGNNIGIVQVGDASLSYGTLEGIPLSPRDYWEPPIPDHKYVDVSKLFVDGATVGDGVGIWIDPYVL